MDVIVRLKQKYDWICTDKNIEVEYNKKSITFKDGEIIVKEEMEGE